MKDGLSAQVGTPLFCINQELAEKTQRSSPSSQRHHPTSTSGTTTTKRQPAGGSGGIHGNNTLNSHLLLPQNRGTDRPLALQRQVHADDLHLIKLVSISSVPALWCSGGSSCGGACGGWWRSAGEGAGPVRHGRPLNAISTATRATYYIEDLACLTRPAFAVHPPCERPNWRVNTSDRSVCVWPTGWVA